MPQDLNTFHGWTLKGRYIRAGQKATHYGGTADDVWIALFDREQTEERPPITIDEIVAIKTTEEHKPGIGSSTKPRIKFDYTRGHVNLWVGNNKQGLAIVKKSGFRFDPQRHRWSAPREDPIAVLDALEKAGFIVEVKGDLPERIHI